MRREGVHGLIHQTPDLWPRSHPKPRSSNIALSDLRAPSSPEPSCPLTFLTPGPASQPPLRYLSMPFAAGLSVLAACCKGRLGMTSASLVLSSYIVSEVVVLPLADFPGRGSWCHPASPPELLGPLSSTGPEREGPPRKKAGLASFRLSGLKGRDQGKQGSQLPESSMGLWYRGLSLEGRQSPLKALLLLPLSTILPKRTLRRGCGPGPISDTGLPGVGPANCPGYLEQR